MSPTPEVAAAAFAADLDHATLPDAVRDRAGLAIADTIGAIVGGSTADDVRSLARRWGGATTRAATVLGTDGVAAPPPLAAFLNGTAGTVLELDEGHRFAGGHPAVHVLPALLADAETGFGSDEAFLTAFVAGYEVAVRTARATNPLAEGYHPHGVWGAVGGAAVVARLRECDPETTRTAMALAANYAQHTRFAAATEGATVRNAYAGMSNLAAHLAVDQAEAGVTGLADGVARHLAGAAAGDVDAAALAAALGERWEIQRGYFKIHAACRFTHAALDAVGQLAAEAPIHPDDVESVTVETYPAAAALTEPDPRNSLQAKFSLPFAVATALVRGETGPDAFADAAIDDRTTALAERVDVQEADDLAERAPARRGARVRVETGTATRRSAVEAPRGGEHDPFTERELREKFESLTVPVLGEGRGADLWEAARTPEPPRVICTLASP